MDSCRNIHILLVLHHGDALVEFLHYANHLLDFICIGYDPKRNLNVLRVKFFSGCVVYSAKTLTITDFLDFVVKIMFYMPVHHSINVNLT